MFYDRRRPQDDAETCDRRSRFDVQAPKEKAAPMKRGKRYRELREGIDRTREYAPGEAVVAGKGPQAAHFTGAGEVDTRLGVNGRPARHHGGGAEGLANRVRRGVR